MEKMSISAGPSDLQVQKHTGTAQLGRFCSAEGAGCLLSFYRQTMRKNLSFFPQLFVFSRCICLPAAIVSGLTLNLPPVPPWPSLPPLENPLLLPQISSSFLSLIIQLRIAGASLWVGAHGGCSRATTAAAAATTATFSVFITRRRQ